VQAIGRARRESLATHGEFRTVIEATEASSETLWWKALLSLLYTAALRLDEAINLTWYDVDFENSQVHVRRRDESREVLAWEPKDREKRVLPVPDTAMQLLADLQAAAMKGNPYVFVSFERWQFIWKARDAGRWRDGQSLVNNLNRRLAILRRNAGVRHFTFHDLRRTSITNWARAQVPHVVRQLAGHSDIRTTEKYYFSVLPDDLEKARQVQEAILNGDLTDPLVTHSGQNGRLARPKARGPGS